MTQPKFEIVIIGAGVAGIASAYYLSQHYHRADIAIIDPLAPMSFTSAQSGENYRDWWPHQTMRDFINHSIDLMEQIACESGDVFTMTRRGYSLATRSCDIDDLLMQLNFERSDDDSIRFHSDSSSYQSPISADWRTAPAGVDVLSGSALIKHVFPSYSQDIQNIFHIRRAGDINSQQLGQYMLAKARASGVKLLQAKVQNIEFGDQFKIIISSQGDKQIVQAEQIINAAGPFIADISQLVGISLPVFNVLQQKIAFEDREKTIPRSMPFSIDIDNAELDWDQDEKELLLADEELSWLAKPIAGNIHCRPDGGDHGSWLKLGWAFNEQPRQAEWQPRLNDQYPEIVLRGAARLNPGLKTYYNGFPRAFHHYGGYYPMTDENWPLIGSTDVSGFYIVGALSGFGSMAACAAGELCAQWVTQSVLPEYAQDLSLGRYENETLMLELKELNRRGIL